jgi:hypothetical protein
MAVTDPNAPVAAPAEALIDPVTGQPIGASATMTFAEWCVVDPALAAADAAAFTQFYPPPVAKEAPPAPAGSAFTTFYGPSSEQKMDRATLDGRVEAMKRTLAPPAAPPPGAPAPVPPDPNAPVNQPAAD